jgi:hypothetical protein
MATKTTGSSAQADGVRGDRRTFKRQAGIIRPLLLGMLFLSAGVFLFGGLQRKVKQCMANCISMADGCRPHGPPSAEQRCGHCSESSGYLTIGKGIPLAA